MSRESRVRKVTDKARHHIEPDETIRNVMWGWEGAPVSGQIRGWLLLVGVLKSRVVAVTDRNVYVFEGTRWTTTGVKGLIAKHPIGSVSVRYDKLQLVVGDRTIQVDLFYRGRAQDIAALASGSSAPPPSAPPPQPASG
jgi:hypothetical protein